MTLPALAAGGPLMAVDDHVETDGKTTHIYVLANDTGDLDASTLTIIASPSLGSAEVIAQGSPRIKYSAEGSSAVLDSFQYSICDSTGTCSVATVTVNIGAMTTTTTTIATTTTTTTTFPSVTTTTQTAITTIAPSTTSTSAPTVLVPSLPSTTTTPTVPASPPNPTVDPIAELALASPGPTAGTTLGEPSGIRLEEDLRYLSRSGGETLRLVAVPAIMVSGLVGFLMVGLPQNVVASLLGFFAGLRSKPKERRDEPAHQQPLDRAEV